MLKAAIVMGSTSDSAISDKVEEVFKEFGVEYELSVISAHRNPVKIKKFAKNLEENGFGVVVAIAALAAHLPGVCASLTILPVIGVPGDGGPLKGQDALYSIVQMPAGIPVACVGIANGKNAALLAIQILATKDEELKDKIREFRKKFGDDEDENVAE
ncbi:MAG: 5-(carboxyamino)imidazole ribonucleotide mutase [Chitinivibrionia bacterium]|nr:5-(carboxyamino)imidazole ribonucleotide mutase [Chitinivibrionia bacterium]